MSFNISRLTLYAVLSSIEEDLRDAVQLFLGQPLTLEEVFSADPQLLERAAERYRLDNLDGSRAFSLPNVLRYLDFLDPATLLNAHRASLPEPIARAVQLSTPALEQLTGVRNRVMHGRPLHHDDLALTIDTAREFVKSGDSLWPHLKTTLRRLKDDATFVMALKIPEPDPTSLPYPHNLPLPDFDETGIPGP